MGKETEVAAFEYEDVIDDVSDEEDEGTEEDDNNDDDSGNADDNDDVDPSEELARASGWVPKDEWKGSPKDWVDAGEFNYRGELMQRIKSQSAQIHSQMKETANLKEALAVLGEHNKKMAEVEYNKAIKDLKSKRREAISNDDFEALDDIEESIDELKASKEELNKSKGKDKEEEKPPIENTLSKEQKDTLREWYEDTDNQWYQDDAMLQPIADKLFVGRLEQNGGNFGEALAFMTINMKKRFPEISGTTRRKGAVTESNGRNAGKYKGGSKTKFTAKDLNEEQARVGRTFVNSGVFDNIQEYVDQLAETGDLG